VFSPSDLALAVEQNSAAFLLALGAAGGGEERHRDGVLWTLGGSPIAYHNAVVRAHLTAESADRVIEEFTNRLQALSIPGSWHVGPSWHPDDLPHRLLAREYERSDEPGMAADLATFEGAPVVAGTQVRRVMTPADLELVRQVLASGFGEGKLEADWACAMFSRLGYRDDSAWRHYLVTRGDAPISCASTFRTGHISGVYFVCTTPDARRQGVGAAVTSHAVRAARAEGAQLAVLTASPMGRGVYERLGFVQCCSIAVLEYDPRARSGSDPGT
jgi:GNAT superfamily N-acetyltransferase